MEHLRGRRTGSSLLQSNISQNKPNRSVCWRYDCGQWQFELGRNGDDSFLFRGDFETGNTNNWSLVVQNLAESFNELVADRGITGDYILCEYEPATDTYSYLGTSFSGADGGLGGVAIASLTTLYWKNENLASTVAPFGSQDADGDDVINFIDVDALNPAVW